MPKERPAFTKFYEQMEGVNAEFFKFVQKLEDEDKLWRQKIQENMKLYQDTGDLLPLSNMFIDSNNEMRQRRKKNTTLLDDARSSLKENSVMPGKPDEDSISRPRRKAFNEASQIMNLQITEQQEPTKVKVERVSTIDSDQSTINDADSVKIKKELLEEMPPPLAPLKRGRKKKETLVKVEPRTSARTKPKTSSTKSLRSTSESDGRNSDVILEAVNISIISLDSDYEPETIQGRRPTRTKKQTMTETKSSAAEKLESAKSVRNRNKKNSEDLQSEDCEETSTKIKHKSTESGNDSDNKLVTTETELVSPPKMKKTNSEDKSKTQRKPVVDYNENPEPTRLNKTKKKLISENNEENSLKTDSIRSTKTKKKKVIESDKKSDEEMEETENNLKLETMKRLRSPSEDSIKKINKRTKRKLSPITSKKQLVVEESRKSSDTQNGDDTIYEDASSANLEFMNSKVMLERLPASSVIKHVSDTEADSLKSPMNRTCVVDKNIPLNQTIVLQKVMNETVVIPKNSPLQHNQTIVIQKHPVLNETVVINKPEINTNVADIMTDDESAEEVVTPPKATKIAAKGTKPVFDLYENSPVKKKIQAFEQLRAEHADEIPIRVTRTKGKAKNKAKEEAQEKTSSNRSSSNSQIPISLKVTPLVNKHPPSYGSSGKYVVGENTISTKSASALKATREEYRQREVRRREKEEEALKKREAFKQAQIEEKKRRREEKELKAKQIREEIEKEKQQRIEMQRAKEDKQKQLILAEKLERNLKIKEEADKKRLLAKQRYEEKKLEEERRRVNEEKMTNGSDEANIKEVLEKQKLEARLQAQQREKKKNLPIYMLKKAPLLPSYDCYDSDDPAAQDNRHERPAWTKSDRLYISLNTMRFVDQKLKNTFFCLQPQTPDLSKIFQQLDPAKLKRNSSAIWKHAPRFTLMPVMDEEDL